MPALLYALGGGWGHLTRAVALARASLARGITLRILTNSPYAPRIASAVPDLPLITLRADLPADQARQETLRVIREAAPDCLIVDTFPRGLGGELATTIEKLAPKRVLIHRDLNPRYVSAMNLHDFVRRHYDLILIPGEDEGRAFADHPAARLTTPWLIPASREPVAPDGILVCAAGDARELSWYGKVASLLRARCIAPICPPGCPPELWIDHWPAVDLIASAGAVVGGAGYNTIQECLAYQVPFVTRPWPRQYDRQWLRARRAAKRGRVIVVRDPEEATSAAREQLRTARPMNPVKLQNGAEEAAAILCRFMNQRDDRLE
jgi:predicted glycosyltransferase